MSTLLETSVEWVERLVAFPTVSHESNLDLIHFVAGYLRDHGIEPILSYDEPREKANLFATVGPEIDGGVVLSGHTDVVPVDNQDWTKAPFQVTRRDGRLYGRGTTDMKSFIACALAMVPVFKAAKLTRPVHLAFSFDEETGCRGAPILVDQMKRCPYRPRIAIVGEPTSMGIVAGHKGGCELTTRVVGSDGHASKPGLGVNAIFYAGRVIQFIEELGQRLEVVHQSGGDNSSGPFDPPYSTFSVGTIRGGAARNIIPSFCEFEWEVRPVPADDPEMLIAQVTEHASEVLVPQMRSVDKRADIVTTIDSSVAGLRYEPESEAVQLIRELTGRNAVEAVSFGTDGGFFQAMGLATVVFGPGSIDQAHQADEYINVTQVNECLDFLRKLSQWLSR